jgi:hypothetical protein
MYLLTLSGSTQQEILNINGMLQQREMCVGWLGTKDPHTWSGNTFSIFGVQSSGL